VKILQLLGVTIPDYGDDGRQKRLFRFMSQKPKGDVSILLNGFPASMPNLGYLQQICFIALQKKMLTPLVIESIIRESVQRVVSVRIADQGTYFDAFFQARDDYGIYSYGFPAWKGDSNGEMHDKRLYHNVNSLEGSALPFYP